MINPSQRESVPALADEPLPEPKVVQPAEPAAAAPQANQTLPEQQGNANNQTLSEQDTNSNQTSDESADSDAKANQTSAANETSSGE